MMNHSQGDQSTLIAQESNSGEHMPQARSEHSIASQQQTNITPEDDPVQEQKIPITVAEKDRGSRQQIAPQNQSQSINRNSQGESEGQKMVEGEGEASQAPLISVGMAVIGGHNTKQYESKHATENDEKGTKEENETAVVEATVGAQVRSPSSVQNQQQQTQPIDPSGTHEKNTKSLQMVRTVDLHQTIISPPKLPTINLPPAKAKPWQRFTMKKSAPIENQNSNTQQKTIKPIVSTTSPAASTTSPDLATTSQVVAANSSALATSSSDLASKSAILPTMDSAMPADNPGLSEAAPILKIIEGEKGDKREERVEEDKDHSEDKKVETDKQQPQLSKPDVFEKQSNRSARSVRFQGEISEENRVEEVQPDKKSEGGRSCKSSKSKPTEETQKYANPFEAYYKRFQEERRKQKQAELKEPLPKITENLQGQGIKSQKPAEASQPPAITHQLSQKLHREHKQENFDEFKGVQLSERRPASGSDSIELGQSAKRESEMLRGAKIKELELKLKVQEESISQLSGEMELHHKSIVSCLAGATVGGASWVLRRNPAFSMLLGTATTVACFLLTK